MTFKEMKKGFNYDEKHSGFFRQLQKDTTSYTKIIILHKYSFCFQASFEDSQKTLQVYRSYTSPSHSYLQVHKPPGPVEVN